MAGSCCYISIMSAALVSDQARRIRAESAAALCTVSDTAEGTAGLCAVSYHCREYSRTVCGLRHGRAYSRTVCDLLPRQRVQPDCVPSPTTAEGTAALCAVSYHGRGYSRTVCGLLPFSCRPSEVRTAANWSTTGCKARFENATFRLILIFLYLEMKK